MLPWSVVETMMVFWDSLRSRFSGRDEMSCGYVGMTVRYGEGERGYKVELVKRRRDTKYICLDPSRLNYGQEEEEEGGGGGEGIIETERQKFGC